MGRGRGGLHKGLGSKSIICGRSKHTWGRGLMVVAGRLHLVHEAVWVEQRGSCDGVHLQRVASMRKQELREERGHVSRRSGKACRPRSLLVSTQHPADLVDWMTERQLTQCSHGEGLA